MPIEVILGAGVTERDMDLLFLEEFCSSKDFANLFMSKIGVDDYEVIKVIHSNHQTGEGINVKDAGCETSRGESDMTVIYLSHGVQKALLIEDKINACAQPNQRVRYDNRGRLAIQNHEYESFDVFMVAPEQYLGSPAAQDYENTVSYEEILDYFNAQDSSRSVYKASLLNKAVNKGNSSYTIQIPNDKVMSFYDSYIDFVETNYNAFRIETSKGGQHGSKSSWIVYSTKNPAIKIKHKTRNCVDLLIKCDGDKDALISKLQQYVKELEGVSAEVISFEREACVRIEVPGLDRSVSVYDQIPEMQECMKAIGTLYMMIGRWRL